MLAPALLFIYVQMLQYVTLARLKNANAVAIDAIDHSAVYKQGLWQASGFHHRN